MGIQFQRIGLLRCPRNHIALGHPFYNQVDLKDSEGVGTKLKIQCGLCFETFTGKVEKVSQRYLGNG